MTSRDPNTPLGKIKEITSTANPIIKDIKGLALKKNRDQGNRFLAEGQKLVTDALDTGWSVLTLIHSKRMLEQAEKSQQISTLATDVRRQGGDVLIVSDKILQTLTRRENAQNCVAVIGQKTSLLKDCQPSGNDVWLALDRTRDPGNLGTIIRTADALGASGVLMVGESTDPFSLETVRATMGSLFHVPIVRCSQSRFIEFAATWRQAGGKITGTHLKGAVDHRTIDYSNGPQILLMGNEQQGLTDELAEVCDNLALIAMDGAADSLNLAIATGIMLFEARRHVL